MKVGGLEGRITEENRSEYPLSYKNHCRLKDQTVVPMTGSGHLLL